MTTLAERLKLAEAYYVKQPNAKTYVHGGELKLDRTALAQLAGMSSASISYAFTGRDKTLEGKKASIFAKFMGVNTDWLVGNKDFGMLDGVGLVKPVPSDKIVHLITDGDQVYEAKPVSFISILTTRIKTCPAELEADIQLLSSEDKKTLLTWLLKQSSNLFSECT